MSLSRASLPASLDADATAGVRLQAEVRPVRDLSGTLRAAMYALYTRYYEATDEAVFQRDLDGKDRVVLTRDGMGCLRGFSSLALLRLPHTHGPGVRAIFSGDTIVDHRYWGQQALAFTWIRLAGDLAREEPATPLYWFLIVKGHRTYRYLHAFTRSYYPHFAAPTPGAEQDLLHRLATWRFAGNYRREAGLVRFPCSRGQLRSAWAEIEISDRGRPEVEYFLRLNPGYVNGDELVCLTRLQRDNLRPLARRLFEQGLPA